MLTQAAGEFQFREVQDMGIDPGGGVPAAEFAIDYVRGSRD